MNLHKSERSAAQYLALGDSYTIGEGVAEVQRWPVQLAELLRAAGIRIAAPQVVARTGWTTDELSTALDHASLDPPYDLVSLLIGVNNQYRGRSAAEYREHFHSLLERAIAYAGGDPAHVLVLSIPDWGRTPFAAALDAAIITAEIDDFNTINRDVARDAGVPHVDITTPTRALGSGSDVVVSDGLHPSAAVYAMWARLALPAALAALRH